MLELLSKVNLKNAPSSTRFNVQTGGFLLLYCLFTDATKCRPGLVGGWQAPNCSGSFATMLLAFVNTKEVSFPLLSLLPPPLPL